MIKPFFLRTLSKAISRYLQLDPQTAKRLSQLAGKVVLIDVQGWEKFFCELTNTGIHMHGKYAGTVDATISGDPFALLQVMKAKNAAEAGLGKISMSGDVALAQTVSDLLRNVDIDWEEQLSQVTGDVIAHKLGYVAKQLRSVGKSAASNMERNFSEYLQEEARMLPSRYEAEIFFNNVNLLRYAVDRLEEYVKKKEET